jgi:hypothetical protein
MVQVGEGLDETDFFVYKHVICKSSVFFSDALRGPEPEPQDRVISIPKQRSDAFRLYYQWLLTDTLYCKPSHGLKSQHRAFSRLEVGLRFELSSLMSALLLGHYLLDTAFCDTVHDAILQCAEDAQKKGIGMSPYPARMYYQKAPTGSPSKQLMVDLVAWTSSHSQLQSLDTDDHVVYLDFTKDLLQAISSRFMSSMPPVSPLVGWETSCKYHSHGDKMHCYRKEAEEYVS